MAICHWQDQSHLLHRILKELEQVHSTQRLILHRLGPRRITHFRISKEHQMTPVAPGFSPVYSALPQPEGAVPNPAQPVPVWTSSDPVNAPVSPDPTGLSAVVVIPATAPVGVKFTLTVVYTNADGSEGKGTLEQTIEEAPAQNITGFVISQTA